MVNTSVPSVVQDWRALSYHKPALAKVLAAAAATLLVAVAGAGAAGAVPTVSVSHSGVVQIRAPGAEGMSQTVMLLVPRPQWRGVVFAQDAASAVVESTGQRRWVIRARAKCDGGALEVTQTVEQPNGTVAVAYRCRSSMELKTAGARIVLRVPASTFAGRGEFLFRRGRVIFSRPLPAKLPKRYHLLTVSGADWLAWRLGERVFIIRTPGRWLAEAFLQDDRQFNVDAFELQLAAAGTEHLRAGQEFSCRVEISEATLSQITAGGAVVVKGNDKWQLARVELKSRGRLAIGDIQWSQRAGPRWKPVELTFPVSGTWDNPFDPDEVDVYAVIYGPGGLRARQPAFAYQDFEMLTPGGDLLRPHGRLVWKVRWTPLQEGDYRVRIVARTPSGRTSKLAGTFHCRGRFGHGFIRRSPNTPYYLQFDDGTPYFAVGENICWDGDEILTAYERWFRRLGQAGGNYCRIWLVRWNMALEWSPQDAFERGCYYGLGRYSLDNAWRLDRVLDLAAQNGIYVMLCLGYHGELREKRDYFGSQCWRFNPYNGAVGGPCQKPDDFWTNADARRLYKRRLRYIVARWGAYPNVLSWEFWNEVWAPAEWIEEMGQFLGDTDIHHHLRTTTYGREATWKLAVMDYAQAHHYGVDDTLRDSAPVIAATSWRFTEKYRKPFMMGEFGIDWKRSDADHDPGGRATNFHNGMWAAVASRSFGTAAIWYWDNYVDKLDLYNQFAAVGRFVREIDWSRLEPVRPPLEAVEPQAPASAPERWAPATVSLPWLWKRQPQEAAAVARTGDLVGPRSGGRPSRLLFGPAKKDLHSPLKLLLDMPADGRLHIRVGTVSAEAELVVRVDGREVLRKSYKAGPPGQGPYKQSKYLQQWKIWQSRFDDDLQVPVAAGRRLVELANVRGDWLEVARISVEPYVDTYRPEVYLLSDGRLLVGWLHNRDSVWWTDRDDRKPKELPSVRLIVGGMRDGAYAVRWYDTWRGEFAAAAETRARAGRLELIAPPFSRDIAVIVRPK